MDSLFAALEEDAAGAWQALQPGNSNGLGQGAFRGMQVGLRLGREG